MSILRSVAYDKTLVGGQAGTIDFDNKFVKVNEKPNLFQIRNYGTDTLFCSVEPGVSGSKYDVAIQAGSTRKLTVPYAMSNSLYLYSSVSCSVKVVANYVDSFSPSDLDYNEATVILNYDALPSVAISDGTHTANVNSDGSLDVNIVNLPVNVEVTVAPTIEITNDAGNPIPVNGTVEIVNDVGNAIPVSLPSTTEIKISDIKTAVTSINLIVDAIDTKLGIIDNVVDGTEMQIDVITLPSIPAGTNSIGKVDIDDSTALKKLNGSYGLEFCSDTNAHTGTFIGFQVLTNTVLSAITATLLSGNTFTGVTLPAGVIIQLPFTSITLTSGSILAYKGA